jgi:2-methylisocitrate lyase-like PEP mutase family enzyme
MNLADLLAVGVNGRRTGVQIPGCWDALTALLVESGGFPAAFLTGGGLAMARLGRPDIGLVTASELVDVTAQITDRITIPLIVDGDTGFGNALTLQRLVRQLEKAGAAAVQIEDQRFPKRCGHMAGKQVVPLDEAVGRIKAAVDSRAAMQIIARTDALAIEGLDAAMDRADAYLAAGADILFIEGPRTLDEAATIAARFAARAPLVHNLVEGGITPATDSGTFFDLGFAVTLHPLLLMHAMAGIAPRLFQILRETGSTDSLRGEIADLAQMNHLTGLTALLKDIDRYA